MKLCRLLLFHGASTRPRDAEGWSVIEEAVSASNTRLLAIIFDYALEFKRRRWLQRREQLVAELLQLPDFYLELKWEFVSSFIPFFSRFSPSDTYRIWKRGSSVRLDFSLVGFEKLKGKRREMSLLFRDAKAAGDAHPDCYLLLVNRSKGIVVDPLEGLDDEEKLAVLTDIINSDAMKSEV